jgi:hypothetical protein
MNKIYGTFPGNPSSIPTVEHWAIITGGSTYVPGDERSRTNPGHGYPASTEYHLVYEAFLNASDFQCEIERRVKNGDKDFRALHILPVQISVQVHVSVGGTS